MRYTVAIFDPDPCKESNCHENATCDAIPELGTFFCHCTSGFVGDGVVCEEENPCLNADYCDVTEECVFTPGSDKDPCRCVEGYERSGKTGR